MTWSFLFYCFFNGDIKQQGRQAVTSTYSPLSLLLLLLRRCDGTTRFRFLFYARASRERPNNTGFRVIRPDVTYGNATAVEQRHFQKPLTARWRPTSYLPRWYPVFRFVSSTRRLLPRAMCGGWRDDDHSRDHAFDNNAKNERWKYAEIVANFYVGWRTILG